MHIRENDSSNNFLSAETYLQFKVLKDGKVYQFDEPVLFASLGNNHRKESYLWKKKITRFLGDGYDEGCQPIWRKLLVMLPAFSPGN